MKNLNLAIAGGLTMVGAVGCAPKAPKADAKPNVVFILVDDMGYGDPSCYGQQKFTTPYIDQLAQEGMRFTQHYAGCTVSAPSRSVLMTGIHTGHAYVRGNREMQPEGQFPMAAEAYTLPEMLKEQGYVTGAFGKWGIGAPGTEGDPNMQGFDQFFGYNCQRHAHRYYPEHLWDNQTKFILEGNDTKNKVVFAPDLIQERAVEFIRKNKDNQFFAYVAIVQPHAELLAPEDDLMAKYRGMYPEVEYKASKGGDYGDPDFDYMPYCSQKETHATFAAMVSRVDRYVGEINDLLKELGIDDNTIVVFSSDNGCHTEGGADPDFFNSNGPHRGYKRDLTDGGIRVPMIVKWPSKVKAGTTNDHISAFWDFMPTFAEVTGAPALQVTDGISMVPTLTGNNEAQQQHEYLYWEFNLRGGCMAIRLGDWKIIREYVNLGKKETFQLYNIVKDPEELTELSAKHPEIVKKAKQLMEEAHVKNPDFLLTYEVEAKKKAAKAKK